MPAHSTAGNHLATGAGNRISRAANWPVTKAPPDHDQNGKPKGEKEKPRKQRVTNTGHCNDPDPDRDQKQRHNSRARSGETDNSGGKDEARCEYNTSACKTDLQTAENLGQSPKRICPLILFALQPGIQQRAAHHAG